MEEWQNPETITLWVIIAVVFLLILLGFIVLLVRAMFQKIVRTKIAESKAKLEYQQNLLDATIKTQEKERKRIASDLHDELISKLTVLKMQEQVKNENGVSANLVNDCISIARRISHDLSPPLLEFMSLDELIKDLLNPWQELMKIDYREDLRFDREHSNEFKIQFIRIFQEVMTNMSKYAKASQINVHIRQSADKLILLIKDNGVGFDMTTKKKGLGLQNIETRVQFLNGRFRINSRLNEGTSSLFIFNTKSLVE
ncbi:MAG: histidine kinase [Crocinitomicaceae bacterium]|nr:histidine kinase [Crocinitomicaceae bacterium]